MGADILAVIMAVSSWITFGVLGSAALYDIDKKSPNTSDPYVWITGIICGLFVFLPSAALWILWRLSEHGKHEKEKRRIKREKEKFRMNADLENDLDQLIEEELEE